MIAESAERFLAERPLRERARLREELDRVDAILVAWQEYDVDRTLPLDYRWYPPVPAEPRDALRARQRELVAQLARMA